jgi:hypothetical protein
MDIVEKLRAVVRAGDLPPNGHVPLAQEAADKIEWLRALVVQWQTLTMRAEPSIVSEAWRRDLNELRDLSSE